MTSRFIIVIIFFTVFSACKTVSIDQENYRVTSDFVIDNPEILEELGVDSSEPIVVTGEYEVFQTDMYKYIVINES
ncbi:hypothetical protein ACFSQ0_10375 [Mesonia sediminis]|uniref:Outer membrane protein assembly factor BamE n=1 Tax=Mesonia sediminis TaxID=1703946 RepID=A0ABW5SH01_9FLAO